MGLLKCILYALCLGSGFFLLGRVLPSSLFHPDRFPYKPLSWEKGGKRYDELLTIRKWQAKVPDMSRYFPRLIPQKKVSSDFLENLPLMIRETCVAEFTHVLLCLLAFPCMALWKGPGGILFTILYILGNIPFILIQRYNRPRFLKLQNKISKQRKETSKWPH